MLIIRVMGGLGNQMQQYALYQKLRILGKEAKLDLSWFYDTKAQENVLAPRKLELNYFEGLPMDPASEEEVRRLRGSGSVLSRVAAKLGHSHVFTESEMYHPEIFRMDEKYLIGYFACNKYYADIMEQLRRLFVFPKAQDPERRAWNEAQIRAMENPVEISAAIHLRRGDYLDPANAGILGGICTKEYYDAACSYLERAAENEGKPLHFYVFSDDPAFAATCHFGTKGEQVTICDRNAGADSLLDIRLMNSCQCVVTANSTFSFWGARLNHRQGHILIRPLWHRNNQVPDPVQMHDYWKGFVLIDRDGRVV